MICSSCNQELVFASTTLVHARTCSHRCESGSTHAHPTGPHCRWCGDPIYPSGLGIWSHVPNNGRWCDCRMVARHLGLSRDVGMVTARAAEPEPDYLEWHNYQRTGIAPNPLRGTPPNSLRGTPPPQWGDRRSETFYIGMDGNRIPIQAPATPIPEPHRISPGLLGQLQEIIERSNGSVGSAERTAAGANRVIPQNRYDDDMVFDDDDIDEETGLPAGFTVMHPHKLLLWAIARLSIDVPNLEDDCNTFVNQLEEINKDFSEAIKEYHELQDEYTAVQPETSRRIRIRS